MKRMEARQGRARKPVGGFTLVEMLVVMVIIALLAVIVMPRILGAKQRAKETRAKEHLRIVRNGVKLFEGDVGAYPVDLAAVASTTPPTQGVVASGENTQVITLNDEQKTGWHGPYFETSNSQLPVNDVTGGRTEGKDWVYYTTPTSRLGKVVNGASGSDFEGTPYTDW